MTSSDPSFSGARVSPDPQAPTSFCQQCGRGLTAQTRRDVGAAVFCEPCLEARLAGSPPPAPMPPPAPLPTAPPNPRLAALLGFIPGVGAMYNEQYAKGIAHLAIFSLLVVFSDANGIFGLFVAGWEFYMVFEAYHTAVARRDGMPLPNPFGFNDLGERMGFARGWTSPGRPGTRATPASAEGYPPPMSPPVPATETRQQAGPAYAWPYGASSSSSFYAEPGRVPEPEPLADVFAPKPTVAAPSTPLTRVPAGAVLLILLGLFFLLSTTGHFRGLSPECLLGFGLIGLAGWIFFSRYRQSTISSPSPSGRLLRALQPTAWTLVSGFLAILDGAHVLSWARSWPVYLIVAGLLALLSRLAPNSPAAAAAPPVQPVPPASRPL